MSLEGMALKQPPPHPRPVECGAPVELAFFTHVTPPAPCSGNPASSHSSLPAPAAHASGRDVVYIGMTNSSMPIGTQSAETMRKVGVAPRKDAVNLNVEGGPMV